MSADPHAARDRAGYDIGKLLMLPVASMVLALDVLALLRQHGTGADGVLRFAGDLFVIAFYAVLISCYLQRGPAVATSPSLTAHAAAIAATWLPFALPFLRGQPPGSGRQALSDVLLVCGMAWSVWSLRTLGRNVSVIAQARDVVTAGPYRWVRHPLYTGEIVSALGIAIAMNSIAAFACWLALCGLQVYRAMREEQVLLRALPAYAAYRLGTAALLPGVRWHRRDRGVPAEAGLARPGS